MTDDEETLKKRYNQIIGERYFISKYTNTSFVDTGELNYTDRQLLIAQIQDSMRQEKELFQSLKNK